MKLTKFVLLTGLLCAALSAGFLASQVKDTKAEVALQAAIKAETVDGDLRGAIEQYKKIAALAGAGRATVATALLRMGGCFEKLGAADAQEARKTYEQVVREYGDQAEVAAEARTKLAALTGAGGAAGSPTLTVRKVLEGDVSGKVSPDGRLLSFTDESSDVAVRDLITGQIRRLTDEGSLSGYDQWAEESVPSPDGKSIAYAWWGAARELRVVGLDGSKPRVLWAGGNGVFFQYLLAWSPDSGHLLAEFVKTDGTRDMMLVAAADGSMKLLKAVGKNPSPGGVFSPDGRYIAWTTKEGLSLFDLQTGTESPLIPDRTNPSVLGWAPDGKHILFSSERSGSADAWLIAVASGKAQGEPIFVRKNWGSWPMGFTRSGAFYYAVSNNIWDVQIAELGQAGGNVSSPSERAFRRGNTRAPDWSPDGRLLAAVDAREPGRAVIIRSMDTGEEREIQVGERTIEMGGLRWTPDGKAVVVQASEPGKGESLIRIDVQTGQVTTLMPLPGLEGLPRFEFSRDGSTIFYRRSGTGIVAHDLKTGQETGFIQKPGVMWGGISPDGRGVAVTVNPDKSRSLFVMPASGGEFRELARVENEKETPLIGLPYWAPDGRSVILTKSIKGNAPRRYELWRIAIEGGEPQRIGQISARQLTGFRLHPDGRRVALSDIKVDLEVWVMENFLPPAKVAK
jgi:Tol biopolymer transport system component